MSDSTSTLDAGLNRGLGIRPNSLGVRIGVKSGDGGGGGDTFFIELEDGSGFLELEDGSGNILLEASP